MDKPKPKTIVTDCYHIYRELNWTKFSQENWEQKLNSEHRGMLAVSYLQQKNRFPILKKPTK